MGTPVIPFLRSVCYKKSLVIAGAGFRKGISRLDLLFCGEVRVYAALEGARSGKNAGADEILREILRDGNRIYIGTGCGEPQHLVRSLVELLPRHRDIEIIQNISMGRFRKTGSVLRKTLGSRPFLSGQNPDTLSTMVWPTISPFIFLPYPAFSKKNLS